MGLTYVTGTVKSKRKRSEALEFLVDSGAVYTLLPEDTWRKLGLRRKRTMGFVLADGTKIERDISECVIELPQGEATTPVILGEKGDEALLGAVTLEILGLVLNPFNRTLLPMRLLMA